MGEDAQAIETELPPKRIAELRDAGEAELIDVRTEAEWEAGRLAGSRQVEVNELTAAADSIPKDRKVVFYCRSGNRSGMAAAAFRQAGWDAFNIAGGIEAWAQEGLPLEPDGGSIAERPPPQA